MLEGFSLRTAVKETAAVKSPEESYWQFIRHARAPELPVVLLEDTGALIGLVLALLGVGLADDDRQRRLRRPRHGRDRPAAASSIAVILAIETKSLLLGESATPEDQRKIVAALEGGRRRCRSST